MREEERRLRNKKYFLPRHFSICWVRPVSFSSLLYPRTRNRRIKRVQSKTGSLAIFGTLGFLRGVGGPAQAAWPGETHSAPICGFALDTARFGCQNPYPRAADGPGESGRTKPRTSGTLRGTQGYPRCPWLGCDVWPCSLDAQRRCLRVYQTRS